MLTESLCVLHLQVNLARLLNGLGDTSLLHPDDSALGITVQRSELYDSLMLELRQEKEKNEQLRADLAKRSIDDRLASRGHVLQHAAADARVAAPERSAAT